MAFDFMDSWDPQNSELGKWDAVDVPLYNLLIPRTGIACCQIDIGSFWRRGVRDSTTVSELVIGAAWRNEGLDPSLTNELRMGEDGVGPAAPRHGAFDVTATGQIQAGKNNPNDGIGGLTAADTIRTGLWQFVECRCLVDDVNGEYEIYVDGTQVLLTVGVDSRDGGAGIIEDYGLNSTGLNGSCYFDDLYVITPTGAAPWNTFLGDGPIDALFPDADGLTIAWTPVPGPAPNFQYVDEAPPVTVDGVTSGTPGNIDVYSHDPVLADIPILGVQQTWHGQKDAPGLRTMRHRVESPDGGFVDESPDVGVASVSSYQTYTYLWNQNPNGPVNWTKASVDGAAFGYRLVA